MSRAIGDAFAYDVYRDRRR